jgi:hypothetical protein
MHARLLHIYARGARARAHGWCAHTMASASLESARRRIVTLNVRITTLDRALRRSDDVAERLELALERSGSRAT